LFIFSFLSLLFFSLSQAPQEMRFVLNESTLDSAKIDPALLESANPENYRNYDLLYVPPVATTTAAVVPQRAFERCSVNSIRAVFLEDSDDGEEEDELDVPIMTATKKRGRPYSSNSAASVGSVATAVAVAAPAVKYARKKKNTDVKTGVLACFLKENFVSYLFTLSLYKP
jgi:hypothetical protein